MNNGAFGENFPYSNFHNLNMDWIIKIAKDFLDQYTNIQTTITNGLTELDEKAQELEQLLDAWYTEHSADIANELARALQEAITAFNQSADAKAAQTIASIPDDYTALSNAVSDMKISIKNNITTTEETPQITFSDGYINTRDTPVAYSTVIHDDPDVFEHAVIDCSNIPAFTISGTGGNAGRLWCFIDASGNIINNNVAGNTETISASQLFFTPSGAKYFIINRRIDAKNAQCFIGYTTAQSAILNSKDFPYLFTNGGTSYETGNYDYKSGYGPYRAISNTITLTEPIRISTVSGVYVTVFKYSEAGVYEQESASLKFTDPFVLFDTSKQYRILAGFEDNTRLDADSIKDYVTIESVGKALVAGELKFYRGQVQTAGQIVQNSTRIYTLPFKLNKKVTIKSTTTSRHIMIKAYDNAGNYLSHYAGSDLWTREIVLNDNKNWFILIARASNNSEITIENTALYIQFDYGKDNLGLDRAEAYTAVCMAPSTGGAGYLRIPFCEVTNAGTIICGGDLRPNQSDYNPIDVGIKRSTDGGKTFSDTYVIFPNHELVSHSRIMDGAMLVNRNTGRVFCFAHNVDVNAKWEEQTSGDMDAYGVYKYSDDDGETWSNEQSLASLKTSDMITLFDGVGNGITMQNGTIVMPMQAKMKSDNTSTEGSMFSIQSCFIYSTDNGATWTLSGLLPCYSSENQIVEYEPGKLMMNAKGYVSKRRVFVTSDMGVTWTAHASDMTLDEPTACQASFIKLPVFNSDEFLFSNPNSATRNNITIQKTTDFTNWKECLKIWNLLNDGYSSMAYYGTDLFIATEKMGSIILSKVPISYLGII